MPHVEKTIFQYEYDSAVEPCLKKSRPDFSGPWTGRDATVYKQKEAYNTEPHKWSFFPGSGGGNCYGTKKSRDEGAATNEHFRYNTEVMLPSSEEKFVLGSETFKSHSSNRPDNPRSYNTSNQHPYQRAFGEKSNSNISSSSSSEATFSETSNAFIGPLFQPPPNIKSGTSDVSDKGTKCSPDSPHYKIKTVELGKNPNRSRGDDGMDYELRQFYKELQELEAETDDQSVKAKESEHKLEEDIQHHFTSSSHSNKASNSLLEPKSTPHTNDAFYDGQMSWREHDPFHGTNSHSFSNHSIPPPGFPCQPPQYFKIPCGPPPPAQSNYPLVHPSQNTLPPIPFPQNDRPPGALGVYPRHNDQPWNSLHPPHEKRLYAQGSSAKMPFSEGVCEYRQHGEFSGNKETPLGAANLPPATSVSHEQYSARSNKLCNRYERKLILLRGVPGSGKTTLARVLLDLCPWGLVFSTDDYFSQKDGYTYDVKLLGDAHNWNQNRAKRAMDDGMSPIIIDNTNIQGWEMKPYVQMALERGYIVEFQEPDTWWKLDPLELEKRNTHGVPRKKISQMLDRYEYDMSVPVVMNSLEPPHRTAPRPPPQPSERWGSSVDFSHHNSTFHNR